MSSEKKSDLARVLAPDDIQRGDYVGVLYIVHQFLPESCFDEVAPLRTEPFRVTLVPSQAPEPLKVVDLCLPFLAVLRPDGEMVMLDVRRFRLCRLRADFAHRVIKGLTAKRES